MTTPVCETCKDTEQVKAPGHWDGTAPWTSWCPSCGRKLTKLASGKQDAERDDTREEAIPSSHFGRAGAGFEAAAATKGLAEKDEEIAALRAENERARIEGACDVARHLSLATGHGNRMDEVLRHIKEQVDERQERQKTHGGVGALPVEGEGSRVAAMAGELERLQAVNEDLGGQVECLELEIGEHDELREQLQTAQSQLEFAIGEGEEGPDFHKQWEEWKARNSGPTETVTMSAGALSTPTEEDSDD